MNIQIFGRTKCFDTKKAERYFKERGIKYQLIDLREKEMSRGEFDSVARAVGGAMLLFDPKSRDRDCAALIPYLAENEQAEKLFTCQQVLKTPIVRNGKQATIGYCPDLWKSWT